MIVACVRRDVAGVDVDSTVFRIEDGEKIAPIFRKNELNIMYANIFTNKGHVQGEIMFCFYLSFLWHQKIYYTEK